MTTAQPATDLMTPSIPMTVRRDDAAFEEVFRAEWDPVMASVRFLVGDDEVARDVAQEAWARAYARWRRVSGYDRPGAWVRRVAIREAVKVAQRRRRLAFEEVDGPATTAPADLDLRDAVLQLPKNQRDAVVLHYLEDLPVDEVAAVLGCAPATARVHLHRGRQRLAELLGEELSDD